jgi:elongation factor Ts
VAEVTVALIREVREITGAGMSDVKKALVAADGDKAKAIDELRKSGLSKVNKRASERQATNGLVMAAEGVMIELACETDFVAKNEQFQELAGDILAHAARVRPASVEALLAETLSDGRTVQASIEALSAVIGEKLELRHLAVFEGKVASYLHRRASDLPPQIGVIVEFEGEGDGAAEAARGAAMQVSALKAQYVTRDEVPAEVVETERSVAEALARKEGKPEAAMTKVIEGRVNGFFKEVVLTEQSSVRDSKRTVKALLDEAGATVKQFARFEVGAS